MSKMKILKKWVLPLMEGGVPTNAARWAVFSGLLIVLYFMSFYNYLLFHSFVELFRVVVVFGIAALAWNARRQIDNPLLVLAGLAFPSIGLIEIAHALAYKGMGIFPGQDANLPTQLWVALRGYECAVLFAAVWIDRITLRVGTIAVMFNLVGVLLLWATFSGYFPACYIEGFGLTAFKINAEYAISAIFAATLLLLFGRREVVPAEVRHLVAWSLAANVVTELLFTQYASVYGRANLAGHLVLLISTYFFYRALLLKGIQEPQALLFNQLQREKALLERSEAELTLKVAERTRELSESNRHLQVELEERRRAQQKLADSEKMIRMTRIVALDAMMMMDYMGCIEDWNPAAERMFGYSEQEALGRQLHEMLVPARYRHAFEKGLAQYHAEGVGPILGKIVEYQALRKDGTEFPVELAVSALEFQGRRHAVGVVRDISERKAAAQMREQLAAIVDSSLDAIVGKDLSGIITSWNLGAQHLYGYTAEEMLGQSIGVLTMPQQFLETEELTARVANGELIENFETERVCKNGRRIDVILTLSPIRSQAGNIIGVSTIVHNITERKNAERELLRVNNALRLLSASNQTLLHAEHECELLHRMCHIVTEIGGYAASWIGFVEDGDRITPQEWSSPELEAELLAQASGWVEQQPSHLWQCISTGQPVQPAEAIPFMGSLELRAVLPLKTKSEVFGCLGILTPTDITLDVREMATLEELAADLSFGIVNLRSKRDHEEGLEQLARTMEDTVRAMAATVEMRDVYTAGHQRRVAELAKAIALELELDADRAHGIELAATIHDLGKINIPAEILTKPARLSKIEQSMIQTHPTVGYEIIKDIEFPWPIAQAVLQHHERLDGSGYPSGLKNAAIILEARIIAVADMVEAMSSHRPYRAGLGIDAALTELASCRGTTYDPDAVDACLRLFREKGFRFSEVWGTASNK